MNESREQSFDFLYKGLSPARLAMISLAAAGVLMLGSRLLAGMMPVHPRFPWMVCAAFLIFYAVFNSVFGLSARNMNRYWVESVISFIGLALLGGLLAWLFSGLSIRQAGTFQWIFLVITFGYLIFLTVIRMMKTIVEFAQKEEWNAPRKKDRER